jgi:uncharacterized membrane protein YkoI
MARPSGECPWEKAGIAPIVGAVEWVLVLGMNTKTKMLFPVLLLAVVAQADEQIQPHDLPEAVRRTVDEWRGDERLKRVTRETVGGREVYFVEIEKNNAPNPRLKIAGDGKIIRDPLPSLTPSGSLAPINPELYANADSSRSLTLEELPQDVGKTAKLQAAGREIVDIDRETWNGKAVYEVEFKERGRNAYVYIDEDGAVVRDEGKTEAEARARLDFMGTQIGDTPAAVQKTIRRLVDEKEIVDIDRRSERGRTVYRFEMRGFEGRRELKIAEDGRVVSDAREAADAEE